MNSQHLLTSSHRANQTRQLTLPGALFACTLFAPQAGVAQTGPNASGTANNPDDRVINENIKPDVRPVEAGEGGAIKPERKYRTAAESLFEWHGHVLWENRYVTEGRDNLSGDNFVSLSTEFALGEFSVVLWLAVSPADEYRELNLNIVYGFRLAEKVVLYAGYNRIQARQNSVHSNDNEVSLDLGYKLSKQVHMLASAYYSFDADGAFVELAIKRRHRISDNTRASAQAVVGTNAGYVSDGHHGLNHLQLRANITHAPSLRMELYVYGGYNIAISRDETRYTGDVLLDDFFWGGVGFTTRF